LNFKSKIFSELTTRELYEIVRSRTQIFLMEQKIICQDFDGVDYDALHCFLEQDGRVVAYLRAYRADGEVKIGRVLSLTHGIGLGSRLLRESIPVIVRHFECDKISLHSQKHAQAFYEKAGFCACSDDFLEEGIPHVSMELKIK
jgi:ElaA protein